MKIIFLDVNGVLNSDKYINYTSKKNIDGIKADIDVKTIELLKKALDITGAKIVLSSSWKNISRVKDLKEIFKQYGISIDDKTPNINGERGLEIKRYLSEHRNIEQYLILDDEIFDSFDEELMQNLILTKENQGYHGYGNGLQSEHIKQIIEKFGEIKNNESQYYDER